MARDLHPVHRRTSLGPGRNGPSGRAPDAAAPSAHRQATEDSPQLTQTSLASGVGSRQWGHVRVGPRIGDQPPSDGWLGRGSPPGTGSRRALQYRHLRAMAGTGRRHEGQARIGRGADTGEVE